VELTTDYRADSGGGFSDGVFSTHFPLAIVTLASPPNCTKPGCRRTLTRSSCRVTPATSSRSTIVRSAIEALKAGAA